MAERVHTTVQDDTLDLIAWKEYDVSSPTAEVLYDVNYRIAEHPIQMGPGIEVRLPEQDPPPLREIIRLWD